MCILETMVMFDLCVNETAVSQFRFDEENDAC